MKISQRRLASDLLDQALVGVEHPAEAVSALMTAAATILQRNFGDEAALALMTQALDQAGAEMRLARTR